MTYLMQSTPTTRRQSPMVRRYGRRSGRALHGLALGGASSDECRARAEADEGPLFARAQDLAKNWNPTGFYTPEEVEKVLKATYAVLNQVSDILDKADKEIPQRDWGGDESGQTHVIGLKRADVIAQFKEAEKFQQAWLQAKDQHIDLLDMPGLKRWVVNSMLVAANCVYAASYVLCITPWWMGVLKTMAAFFEDAIDIAKSIGGALKKVGQTVLKVPDTLSTLFTVAKWSLILGVPLYVIFRLNQARGSRSES